MTQDVHEHAVEALVALEVAHRLVRELTIDTRDAIRRRDLLEALSKASRSAEMIEQVTKP